MPPIFKNRPNPFVQIIGGGSAYLSRSVAVVMSIACLDELGELSIAMGQRGLDTPDFQGMWCLPCGYLDWDETCWEAAVRETYEEIGLDVLTQKTTFMAINPWKVSSHPSVNRQNVSHHHGVLIEGPRPILNTPNPRECSAVEWKSLKWIRDNEDVIAFNHAATAQSFIYHLKDNGWIK